MEEKEMEIFTDIMRKCGVNTEKHTWSELEDMAKAMKAYHQAKLKLLGIGDVSQQRELFVKEQGKWLMANTNLSVEQIIDFEMEFINK